MPMPGPPPNLYSQQYQGQQGPYAPPGANYPGASGHPGYHQNYPQHYQNYRPQGPPPAGYPYPGYGQPQQ